jgi:DNA helicase HerA-like ATPase
VYHGVEPDETTVTYDLGERVGHMLVIGTTRVGKTRLAELLITQDIRRTNAAGEHEVVIVFDPKGDADLLRRMYAESHRAGRQDNFWVFHLGWPDISARYNAVGRFSRISEVASRVAGQLSGKVTPRPSVNLPGGSSISSPARWSPSDNARTTASFCGMSPISVSCMRLTWITC